MADKIPVKAKYSGADVIALQEFEPTDTIPLSLISGFPAGVTLELGNNSIGALSDVSSSISPSEDQVLAWNNTTGEWEPRSRIDNDVAAVWGNITGILSDQLDLQSALDSKEPANANIQLHIADNSIHFTQTSIVITESQISDLQNYALVGHTHLMADITDSTWISDITGQSIINLADVDSAMAPADGQVLTWNNTTTEWEAVTPSSSQIIFGSYFQMAESLGTSTTTSTTPVTKLTMVTPVLPVGTYRIGISYGWNHNSTTSDFEAQLNEDGVQKGEIHKQEVKDSAGTGGSTGTSQKYYATRTFYSTYNLAATHTFDIEFRTDSSGTASSMWDTVIEIWRVS